MTAASGYTDLPTSSPHPAKNSPPVARTNPLHEVQYERCSFEIDIERCPRCGGRLKIIAAIVDPVVITKILAHLHLPARAPPRSPARRVDLFQAA